MENLYPCEAKKIDMLITENNKLNQKVTDLYSFASMIIDELVNMYADPDEAAEVFDKYTKYTKQLDYIMNGEEVNINAPLPWQFHLDNM